jgi:hypothetical protein
MLKAPATTRIRYSLRATAVSTAALALVSIAGTAVAGTAYAAPRARFGSPYGSRSHGTFGAPIPSVVYSGTQAVTQLTAIATATRSASTGGAVVTGTQFYGGITAHLTVTSNGTTAAKVQFSGPLSEVLFESPTEQYSQLDLTDPEVLAALRLLHVSNVHYAGAASAEPLISPADMLEELYGNGAPPISTMKRIEHDGSVEYQVTLNVSSSLQGEFPNTATVTTDRSGRIVGFNEAIARSMDGAQYSVRYGPQSVTLPASGDVVDATQLEQAMVSAHLPQALAFVALQAFISASPSSGTETLTQFRASARAVAVDPDNGMGGIAVTVADVPDGVSLTARNPFTNANVTVHATLDGHGWVSVTDSSGRPVDPDGIVVVTSMQLGRTAADRLGLRH